MRSPFGKHLPWRDPTDKCFFVNVEIGQTAAIGFEPTVSDLLLMLPNLCPSKPARLTFDAILARAMIPSDTNRSRTFVNARQTAGARVVAGVNIRALRPHPAGVNSPLRRGARAFQDPINSNSYGDDDANRPIEAGIWVIHPGPQDRRMICQNIPATPTRTIADAASTAKSPATLTLDSASMFQLCSHMFEPGVPLSHYVENHPLTGVLLCCNACSYTRTFNMDVVCERLRQRNIDPQSFGVCEVAKLVREPCECGAKAWVTQPAWEVELPAERDARLFDHGRPNTYAQAKNACDAWATGQNIRALSGVGSTRSRP